jgi:hypothetical protein
VLGAVGTFLGTWNTNTLNSQRIQYQDDVDFSNAIASSAPFMVTGDTGTICAKAATITYSATSLRAMIAFTSLYARTETGLHRLEVVVMAQTAGQSRAMVALSGIVSGDDTVQHPDPSEASAANAIKQDVAQYASDVSQLCQSSPSPGQTPNPQDTPLTQSATASVRANAALLLALPVNKLQGWGFIGDTAGVNNGNGTFLTASKVVSSPTLPSKAGTFFACQDINIRQTPFSNGALGAVVGIAPRGSLLSFNGDKRGFSAKSRANGEITAWWAYLTVESSSNSPNPSASQC